MNISIGELLKVEDHINLIDLRSVEKYNDNHIPDAKNVPMLLLLKEPEKYLNKEETYYIYCQMGLTSGRVCTSLRKKGYRVINILTGYEGWLLEK